MKTKTEANVRLKRSKYVFPFFMGCRFCSIKKKELFGYDFFSEFGTELIKCCDFKFV